MSGNLNQNLPGNFLKFVNKFLLVIFSQSGNLHKKICVLHLLSSFSRESTAWFPPRIPTKKNQYQESSANMKIIIKMSLEFFSKFSWNYFQNPLWTIPKIFLVKKCLRFHKYSSTRCSYQYPLIIFKILLGIFVKIVLKISIKFSQETVLKLSGNWKKNPCESSPRFHRESSLKCSIILFNLFLKIFPKISLAIFLKKYLGSSHLSLFFFLRV